MERLNPATQDLVNNKGLNEATEFVKETYFSVGKRIAHLIKDGDNSQALDDAYEDLEFYQKELDELQQLQENRNH